MLGVKSCISIFAQPYTDGIDRARQRDALMHEQDISKTGLAKRMKTGSDKLIACSIRKNRR